MKSFIITILALVFTPLVFSLFQKGKYKVALQPEIKTQVEDVLSKHNVQSEDLKFDHLDVKLSGVIDNVSLSNASTVIDDIKKDINKLEGSAVRASAQGFDLQIHGLAGIEKLDDDILVSGTYSSVDSVNSCFNVDTLGVEVEHSSELRTDKVFRNATSLSAPGLPGWTKAFLTLKGDRGYTLSSSDNIVRPFGDVTVGLKSKLIGTAKEAGIQIDPTNFSIIDASPAEFELSKSETGITLNATVPEGYDVNQYFKASDSSVTFDDFTAVHSSIDNQPFSDWVSAFFARKGPKGVHILGDKVTLSGVGTPSLEKKWLAELKASNLNPSSDLTIYPSEFHYPNYKRESKIDADKFKVLSAVFKANPIFFDSSSSVVREDQQPKVDTLASAIKQAGGDLKFVIGGHADSTGNVEFNQRLSKERSESVVTALAEQGVSKENFTVVSFGAAKASSAGSNESDRKVEILIK